MKKRIISNIVPALFAILVIYTISLLWNKITIPFENPEEVVGFYAKNNHHNFNDCKSKGIAKMVDRDYIVKPNEIIEIRFNV